MSRATSTLNTNPSIGALLSTMGDFRHAAETFRQVLERYEVTQGVQHRGYMNALSNLTRLPLSSWESAVRCEASSLPAEQVGRVVSRLLRERRAP